jgi:DNA excision repair protein ERCC-2
MVERKQIVDRNEFFEFDTMRQCAQCLGRVMRRKNDYGLMILADSRFTRPGKY